MTLTLITLWNGILWGWQTPYHILVGLWRPCERDSDHPSQSVGISKADHMIYFGLGSVLPWKYTLAVFGLQTLKAFLREPPKNHHSSRTYSMKITTEVGAPPAPPGGAWRVRSSGWLFLGPVIITGQKYSHLPCKWVSKTCQMTYVTKNRS